MFVFLKSKGEKRDGDPELDCWSDSRSSSSSRSAFGSASDGRCLCQRVKKLTSCLRIWRFLRVLRVCGFYSSEKNWCWWVEQNRFLMYHCNKRAIASHLLSKDCPLLRLTLLDNFLPCRILGCLLSSSFAVILRDLIFILLMFWDTFLVSLLESSDFSRQN